MRKPLIAGNWKMNKNVTESISLIKDLINHVNGYTETEIVICPPFTSLWVARELIQDTNIVLGAQNMCCMDDGAFTGEISARMLQNIGCDYVILGHSERRDFFKESSTMIAKKVLQAIKFRIKPIICVGEKLSEKEAGKAQEVVREEMEAIFNVLDGQQITSAVFAYEPIWAIGTGKSSTPQDANEMVKYIRKLVEKKYDGTISQQIRILYGGSVNPENIESLMSESDIDGALVGGSSLNALAFSRLIKYKHL